jgi:hypothetical protein
MTKKPPALPELPPALVAAMDVVLAYRPKPKSRAAKKRVQAAKQLQEAAALEQAQLGERKRAAD